MIYVCFFSLSYWQFEIERTKSAVVISIECARLSNWGRLTKQNSSKRATHFLVTNVAFHTRFELNTRTYAYCSKQSCSNNNSSTGNNNKKRSKKNDEFKIKIKFKTITNLTSILFVSTTSHITCTCRNVRWSNEIEEHLVAFIWTGKIANQMIYATKS